MNFVCFLIFFLFFVKSHSFTAHIHTQRQRQRERKKEKRTAHLDIYLHISYTTGLYWIAETDMDNIVKWIILMYRSFIWWLHIKWNEMLVIQLTELKTDRVCVCVRVWEIGVRSTYIRKNDTLQWSQVDIYRDLFRIERCCFRFCANQNALVLHCIIASSIAIPKREGERVRDRGRKREWERDCGG